MKLWTYISILFIILALNVAAQEDDVPFDIVCKGSERTYRVNGENDSDWKWILYEVDSPNKSTYPLPEPKRFVAKDEGGNQIQGSEITIAWNYKPGIYYLEAEQISKYGCDSLVNGYVEIVEAPVADAGAGSFICKDDVISLDLATADNYSAVSWIGGDGSFDDATLLNPVYTPGPADITAGFVELSLIAYGNGFSGGCDQAVSTVIYSINDLSASIFAVPNQVEKGQPIRLNGHHDGNQNIISHKWSGDIDHLIYLDNTAIQNPVFNENGDAPTGTYTFIYSVTDEAGCEAIATITIKVTTDGNVSENNKPLAVDAEYTSHCYPLAVYLSDLVADPDNDKLTFSIEPIIDIPDSKGQVIIYEDGLFQYYSDGYEGQVTFDYEVCDNGFPSLCDTGTITINVLPEADCNKLPEDNEEDEPECKLFIPEGFSPNGDKVHDYFEIFCIENYPNATIRIFDRAGNKLYQKQNYGNKNIWDENCWWDGSSENKRTLGRGTLPAGNYLYILELGNGKVKTGTVMIAY